jgi:hypothetical protein
MNIRTRIVVLAILPLVLMVGGWSSAQVQQFYPVEPVQPPVLLSGNDIGFRVEGRQGKTQVGTLVVRVDGRWVEASLGVGGPRKITVR